MYIFLHFLVRKNIYFILAKMGYDTFGSSTDLPSAFTENNHHVFVNALLQNQSVIIWSVQSPAAVILIVIAEQLCLYILKFIIYFFFLNEMFMKMSTIQKLFWEFSVVKVE